MTNKNIFDKSEEYRKKIDAMRPLSEGRVAQIRQYYKIGLTWSSNALEGNSLSESETKVLPEEGLTVGGKPIRDYYEATGHAQAYDFMYDIAKDRPVSEVDKDRQGWDTQMSLPDNSEITGYNNRKVLVSDNKMQTATASKKRSVI